MKVKKLVVWLVIILFIFSLNTIVSVAKKPVEKEKPIKYETLSLFEKDPDSWQIIEKGAWGSLKYKPSGTELEFMFHGHKLLPDTLYSLIYYPDPWPGYGLIIIGEGLSDEDGNLNIKGSENIGDLPRSFDQNKPEGAKIWLVLSSDIDHRSYCMIGWNPAEYLFENELIKFDDIDFYQR